MSVVSSGGGSLPPSGVIALGRAVGRVTALVGANPGAEVVVVGVGSTTIVVGRYGWVTVVVVDGEVMVVSPYVGAAVGLVLLYVVVLPGIVTTVVVGNVVGGSSVTVEFTSGMDVGSVGGSVTVGGTVSVAFVTGGGIVVSGGAVPVGAEELELPVPGGRRVNGMLMPWSVVVGPSVAVGLPVYEVSVAFAVDFVPPMIPLIKPPRPRGSSSVVAVEETTPVGASRMPDSLEVVALDVVE